jgi:SAM-dependent methyltransferase
VRFLEDDQCWSEAIDKSMDIKQICVLGAGKRPLSSFNNHEFLGLEDIGRYTAVNVDIRGYLTTDLVMDLSKKKWKIDSNKFDIVIAEHIAEHVPDRMSFISECLRITKPNGLLIIEVPNWKHDSAHNTLEHLTTWGRAIFNDSYINDYGKKWKIEKVVYRMTYPFLWKSFYIGSGFIPRQIDRFTHKISGLRFYIRVLK